MKPKRERHRESGEMCIRDRIDSSYRIKKPIFGTYEDLEQILKITFKMYEDFKNVLSGYLNPVSYTHLDVYKRQYLMWACRTVTEYLISMSRWTATL